MLCERKIGISDNEVIEVIQWRRNQNRHRRGRAGRAESVWREQKRNSQGIDGQKIHLSLFSSERRNLFTFPEIPFILGKAHILAAVQRGCAVPARTGKRV